ncbi:MAG: (5-formylfuran-3-yl)methyl phosphate synthase [Planctomycetes bacterium]|nr:(5-formylfuran-3-yl)methyl phosphate synthase [Planctomycetota bacterium]
MSSSLLISVRNLDEARLALAGGADVIDVKQPARGPLGAVDAAELRPVVEEMSRSAPISAALGELLDPRQRLSPESLGGLSYAKFGLADCASQPDWADLWLAKTALFPLGVSPVAVVYADPAAAAPPPREILAVAASAGAPVVLVDTFDKQRGNLLTHWTLDAVAQFVTQVQDEGLKIALAGSLDLDSIRQLLPLEPDFIAVRGAVCHGGRAGAIELARVRSLASMMRGGPRELARERSLN